MPVEFRPDAARGNAVAGRAVLRDAERHILHIGDDAALAGGIAGKFGSVGGAGGSHENNGPDGRRQTVFFRHCNGPLEIDPDLIAPLLNTGIVDQDLHAINVRQLSGDIGDIVFVVRIWRIRSGRSFCLCDRGRHEIDADDLVPFLQVAERTGAADPARCSGDDNLHTPAMTSS